MALGATVAQNFNAARQVRAVRDGAILRARLLRSEAKRATSPFRCAHPLLFTTPPLVPPTRPRNSPLSAPLTCSLKPPPT